MWVMGGGVGGGKVYGNWPGLSQADLYQGRDLAITTDFRTVLGVMMRRHLGLDERGLQTVLPGFGVRPDGLGNLIRV
jgi:uncharacterized protein (DUF1501 family)